MLNLGAHKFSTNVSLKSNWQAMIYRMPVLNEFLNGYIGFLFNFLKR